MLHCAKYDSMLYCTWMKRRKARKARNPRTGERVDVGPKSVVTFKPGKEMEEKIRRLDGEAELATVGTGWIHVQVAAPDGEATSAALTLVRASFPLPDPSSSNRPRPPSEFETTRSYSEGSAP